MNRQLIAMNILRNYPASKAHIVTEILNGQDKAVRADITARVVVGWIKQQQKKGTMK